MAANIILAFSESKCPQLREVTNLLFDFELAYDFGVLLIERPDFRFSQYFWYRNGRPVKNERRLNAARITLQSPLYLDLVATSLGGIFVLLQIITLVKNWSLDREKLELEVDKLRREQKADRQPIGKHSQDFERLMHGQDTGRIVHRLNESEFILTELELKFGESREDRKTDQLDNE